MGCDRAALCELVAASARVRGWLDAFDARVAVAASRLASEGSCEPAAAVLAGGGRRAARDAQAAAARGVVCEAMPLLGDALALGRVSAGHADAIVRVAAQLDETATAALVELEAALVASAVVMSVEAFEREVRDVGRLLSRDDGIRQHERLRSAAVTATVDGPPRPLPHPHHLGPGVRRPPVSGPGCDGGDGTVPDRGA